MKNLMKYEMIRMKYGILISLAALAVLEIVYLFSMLFMDLRVTAFSVVFLGMAVIFLVIGIAVKILSQYSQDLNTKSGYMLFMTPNSYYKIVGSKLLTSMLLILGLGVLVSLGASLDGVIAALRLGDPIEFDLIGILRELNIHITVESGFRAVGTFLTGFFGWVSFFTPIFFVMTLNRVYFINKKGRGIVSLVLYLILMTAYGWVENLVLHFVRIGAPGFATFATGVMTALLAVGCYFGTVKILEKKISL